MPAELPDSTTSGLKRWASGILARSSISFSPIELDWLIEEISGMSRLDQAVRPAIELPDDQVSSFKSGVLRRAAGEPIQHILGYTEFYGHRMQVSPDALIPRPETEGLVELGLAFLADKKECHVVDIGTGSGCIAIALALSAPQHSYTGIEISEPALELARRNGAQHNVRVEWCLGDFYDADLLSLGQPPDLIVSNPPYIPEADIAGLQVEVRAHDPIPALTPGDDHLAPYRALGLIAGNRLNPGGSIAVEIEERFGGEIRDIFEAAGISRVAVHNDLAGRPRYVTGEIIKNNKDFSDR